MIAIQANNLVRIFSQILNNAICLLLIFSKDVFIKLFIIPETLNNFKSTLFKVLIRRKLE